MVMNGGCQHLTDDKKKKACLTLRSHFLVIQYGEAWCLTGFTQQFCKGSDPGLFVSSSSPVWKRKLRDGAVVHVRQLINAGGMTRTQAFYPGLFSPEFLLLPSLRNPASWVRRLGLRVLAAPSQKAQGVQFWSDSNLPTERHAMPKGANHHTV